MPKYAVNGGHMTTNDNHSILLKFQCDFYLQSIDYAQASDQEGKLEMPKILILRVTRKENRPTSERSCTFRTQMKGKCIDVTEREACEGAQRTRQAQEDAMQALTVKKMPSRYGHYQPCTTD